MITLQAIGACLALVVGLNGLFRPVAMARSVGMQYFSLVGLVEIRVLFGSFLVALPIYCLFKNSSSTYEILGIAALAAFVIKSTFTTLDRCPLRDIWFGILVDLILAALLLSHWWL